MTRIQIHDLDSAPAGAREHLEHYVKTSPTGRVLNLHGAMAHSPIVLEMYARMRRTIEEMGRLEGKAQWAAMLAAGIIDGSTYSSTLYAALGKERGLTEEQVRAIAQAQDCGDASIDALVRVAREIGSNHGRVTDETWSRALAAGWSDRQLAELYAYIGLALFIDYFVNYSGIESDLVPARSS